MIHSNHGPISYRFLVKLWFHSKSAIFSSPLCTLHPTERVPFGIEYRHMGVKKLEWWCYRDEKEVWRSAVCIQYANVTDRWTDTGPQHRLRLCIASRGIKWVDKDSWIGTSFLKICWCCLSKSVEISTCFSKLQLAKHGALLRPVLTQWTY